SHIMILSRSSHFCLLCNSSPACFCLFFFNDTPTTEIYTLSLHDALPIFANDVFYNTFRDALQGGSNQGARTVKDALAGEVPVNRSEEHTSELQSRENLVCRLLLEKKKKQQHRHCH